MYAKSAVPAHYHATKYQSHHYYHHNPNNYGDSSPTSSIGSFNSESTNQRDVPATVRTLLIAVKQLQNSLGRWSIGQLSDTQVSDFYVQFGTAFNATVLAFAWYGIDMSDIHPIPKQLRRVLENCLGEEPSPRTLSRYMPEIRRILYSLLEGLRAKQPEWREVGGT